METDGGEGDRRRRTLAGTAAGPNAPDSAGLQDEAGLRAAWDQHAAELYRFARRALRDDGAAQDLVQEVFLKAWRSGATYDASRSSLRTWLYAIARNAVLDAHRHRASVPEPVARDDDWETVMGVVDDPADTVLAGAVVTEALRSLDAVHRNVLVQTQLLGRPYAEVAAATGVPVGTVKSRVFYALRMVKAELAERGVTL